MFLAAFLLIIKAQALPIETVAPSINPKSNAKLLVCSLAKRSKELPVSNESGCGFKNCDNTLVNESGKSHSKKIEGETKKFNFVNMRSVLRDIVFRFGARSPGEDGNGEPHLKDGKHDQSLNELCKLGFTDVFAANNKFDKTYDYKCPDGSMIHYSSVSYEDGGREFNSKIKLAIDKCIQNLSSESPTKCRVAYHCTNGEHRAGIIAAMTLMTYCGFDLKSAKKYWDDRQGGAQKSELVEYNKQIESFSKNNPNLNVIDSETRKAICPDNSGRLPDPPVCVEGAPTKQHLVSDPAAESSKL